MFPIKTDSKFLVIFILSTAHTFSSNMTGKFIFAIRMTENIMGKGEKNCLLTFSLPPQCFLKGIFFLGTQNLGLSGKPAYTR